MEICAEEEEVGEVKVEGTDTMSMRKGKQHFSESLSCLFLFTALFSFVYSEEYTLFAMSTTSLE